MDSGEPSNALHLFKSDLSADGLLAAYLISVGSQLQPAVKVVSVSSRPVLQGTTIFPKTMYFSKIDSTGSERGLSNVSSVYPEARSSSWNVVDVMLSSDKASVYIFFSYVYDFIGKCSFSGVCNYLSTVQFNSTATVSTFILRGCTRTDPGFLACSYEAAYSYAVVMTVREADGLKREVLGSGLAGLGRPLSPPAYDPSAKLLYMMCEISGSQVILRMDPSTRNLAVAVTTLPGRMLTDPLHSLVFLNTNATVASKQLVGANQTSILTFTGTTFGTMGAREIDAAQRSLKDLAVLNNKQLYVLLHSLKSWSMYTHCAPCPANSWSVSGATRTGIQGDHSFSCYLTS